MNSDMCKKIYYCWKCNCEIETNHTYYKDEYDLPECIDYPYCGSSYKFFDEEEKN